MRSYRASVIQALNYLGAGLATLQVRICVQTIAADPAGSISVLGSIRRGGQVGTCRGLLHPRWMRDTTLLHRALVIAQKDNQDSAFLCVSPDVFCPMAAWSRTAAEECLHGYKRPALGDIVQHMPTCAVTVWTCRQGWTEELQRRCVAECCKGADVSWCQLWFCRSGVAAVLRSVEGVFDQVLRSLLTDAEVHSVMFMVHVYLDRVFMAPQLRAIHNADGTVVDDAAQQLARAVLSLTLQCLFGSGARYQGLWARVPMGEANHKGIQSLQVELIRATATP